MDIVRLLLESGANIEAQTKVSSSVMELVSVIMYVCIYINIYIYIYIYIALDVHMSEANVVYLSVSYLYLLSLLSFLIIRMDPLPFIMLCQT